MPYPCIRQHSEEDCGAACLATVAKHYKRTFTLTRIREAVGTGSRGTTLLGLRRGAEACAIGYAFSAVIDGHLKNLHEQIKNILPTGDLDRHPVLVAGLDGCLGPVWHQQFQRRSENGL